MVKPPITSTKAAGGAHEACTRCCNSPKPLTQFVAPRQNAGGLPPQMRDGTFASETQQPHGKRHGQAAVSKKNSGNVWPQNGRLKGVRAFDLGFVWQ